MAAAVTAVQKGSELPVPLCGARAAAHAAKDNFAKVVMLKHNELNDPHHPILEVQILSHKTNRSYLKRTKLSQKTVNENFR